MALCPVGEPLVPGEILLVDKGLRSRWARDAVGLLPYLHEGLGQASAAPQVRTEARREISRFFTERPVYQVREAVGASVRAPSSSATSLARAARLSRSSAAISAIV